MLSLSIIACETDNPEGLKDAEATTSRDASVNAAKDSGSSSADASGTSDATTTSRDAGAPPPEDAGAAPGVELELVKTQTVHGGGIWSGLSTENQVIHFTGMIGGELTLRKYDPDLEQIGRDATLTGPGDYPDGEWIADHAHLYLNGYIYLSYCNHHADKLYLIKIDTNGQRIGERVMVVENEPEPTNDMHIASDGEKVYVLWGRAGFDHLVRAFDPDTLAPLSDPTTFHSRVRLAQLGSTVFHEGQFFRFSGDERQRNLVLARFDPDFRPADPFITTLVPTVNDSWNWFASGNAHDPIRGLWFIGYNHMFDGERADGDATIDLAVFRDDSFELLWHGRVSKNGFHRAHLTVLGDHVYLAYDGRGVTIKKFRINVR